MSQRSRKVRAAPRNSANRFGESFFVKSRFEKRRNTYGIPAFCNLLFAPKSPTLLCRRFFIGFASYWLYSGLLTARLKTAAQSLSHKPLPASAPVSFRCTPSAVNVPLPRAAAACCASSCAGRNTSAYSMASARTHACFGARSSAKYVLSGTGNRYYSITMSFAFVFLRIRSKISR